MPRSSTGRVVVDIEPELKKALYVALASENKTLKQWLIDNAKTYLARAAKTDSKDEL